MVGPYRVLQELGSGASGTVFRVQHDFTNRIEAMKVLRESVAGNPELVQRFLREIQVHAALQHPNIAAVHNALCHGDHLVLVMEYVQGEPLEDILPRTRMSLRQVVSLGTQILAALECAHERGVVHRDVSAANVLVTPNGLAKLTDFGLARPQTNLRLTQPGMPVGSYLFMPPEQVRGTAEVDTRSDIYSAGVLLYMMATGAHPFPSGDPYTLMNAHVTTPAPPASSVDPRLPKRWDGVLARALEKDPALRWPTAREFREALASLPTEAMPPPKPRRRPLLPLLRYAVAGLISAGLAMIGLTALRPRHSTQIEIPGVPVAEIERPSALDTPAPEQPPAEAAVPPTSTAHRTSTKATVSEVQDGGTPTQEVDKPRPKRNAVARFFGRIFGRKSRDTSSTAPDDGRN
jgi:serine/threonine-protein kinase